MLDNLSTASTSATTSTYVRTYYFYGSSTRKLGAPLGLKLIMITMTKDHDAQTWDLTWEIQDANAVF